MGGISATMINHIATANAPHAQDHLGRTFLLTAAHNDVHHLSEAREDLARVREVSVALPLDGCAQLQPNTAGKVQQPAEPRSDADLQQSSTPGVLPGRATHL
jgi:hypothetical protein